MHFKGRHIKQGKGPEKNTLYLINDNQNLIIEEEDGNSTDEVECVIHLSNGQEAVFGKEYRAPFVDGEGEKRADIMCVMVDDINTQTETYIYEIKHSITGADRVWDILGQLNGSICQKESMLLNVGCEEYKAQDHIGVITTGIKEEPIIKKISDVKDEMKEIVKNQNIIPDTISKKKIITLLSKGKSIESLALFLQHKMLYKEVEIPLEIINLVQRENSNVYECSLEMAIHI